MSRSRLAVLFLSVLPLGAETFVEQHARDVATNPADIRFLLTTGGPSRFHSGERIPISLEFSSTSHEKYKLNGASYDRSGRLPTEEFVLERADIVDPFEDYFGIGVLGGIGGGLRGYPVLDSTPYRIELVLNDWFRFDRPGLYRLYIKSHRLTRERATGEAAERTVEFAAVSNILQIEILPRDPGWEQSKLAEVQAILQSSSDEERHALAERELRFLGTPSAVRFELERARRSESSPRYTDSVGGRARGAMLWTLSSAT